MLTLRGTELKQIYDIAIFGSGFAGSLMAMIAKRQGHSVVLLERGKHPRMMIGESSTPLANLLLDQLAASYDLPAIAPLSKWGSWQRAFPQLACGLKRGFTFYHHTLGLPDSPDPEHLRQLLVAASPRDEIADTHWYRADFDWLLVQQAQALGVDYIDEARIDHFSEGEDGVTFDIAREQETYRLQARFAIDATGPRGFLHRALRLSEVPMPEYPATQALYCHFSGVSLPSTPSNRGGEAPPYPAEQAAVHHLFEGGWIWVLRFNNGITSAGVAAKGETAIRFRLSEGEPAWRRLLDSIPALREQFTTAHATLPFTWVPRLSFLSGRVSGRRWAMLPSAAGFIDPLLSTGFPLTLLGVSRLATILGGAWDSASFQSELQTYSAQTTDELLATSRLLAALYANMGNFRVFKAISLMYFTAATYSETARRLGKQSLAPSFLLHDHPHFGPACKEILAQALHLKSQQDSILLLQDIQQAIEPFDVAGLSTPCKEGWYPAKAEDLLQSAAKVNSTRREIEEMLQTCRFYDNEPQ